MTYSHNSVGNTNLKMTTATATTKAARATGGGGVIVASGLGGGKQQYNRRTPPMTTTSAVNKLAFENNNINNNNDALHSNSIACSTNMQQHPLMSGSPSNVIDVVSTPGSGSYFGNQRKQQQQQRNTQWQSPNSDNSGISGGGGGGGAFFHKNNYAGQYFANNSRRKQQRDERQNRTPNGINQSPATILGGGININSSDSSERTSASTGRKRRPKYNFQSPIISKPDNLGVGGNISPTHPLLPAVLTHFAGSKYFDAPAPSAVPKPPQHWMQSDSGLKNVKSRSAAAIMCGGGSSNLANCGRDIHTLAGHVVKSSKRNLLDDFDTHNLKLLLNVQS